jgi:hypothetical protein
MSVRCRRFAPHFGQESDVVARPHLQTGARYDASDECDI